MSNPTFKAAGLRVFERGWLSANNVLFDGASSHETVLVDSGYCTHAAQTLALVRNALGDRPLDRIINTHLHSDHCGGNDALQRAFACRVDVPRGEADKVDRWDEAALSYRDTGQQCPRFRRTGVIECDAELRLGDRYWQVIAAPGHDPESVVLYQAELQILISADALWANGFGVVFPELEGQQAFTEVHATLDRIAGLPVSWVIPGHGAPFSDCEPALERAYRRLGGFVADPARHARYAAKVLIKFHLLEIQQQPTKALLQWLSATRYMRLIHAAYFDSIAFDAWCQLLLRELAESGAIAITDASITNI